MLSDTITIPSDIVFQSDKKVHRCCFSEGQRNLFKDSESNCYNFFFSSAGVDLHSVIANNQQVFHHIGAILYNKTVGVFHVSMIKCSHSYYFLLLLHESFAQGLA